MIASGKITIRPKDGGEMGPVELGPFGEQQTRCFWKEGRYGKCALPTAAIEGTFARPGRVWGMCERDPRWMYFGVFQSDENPTHLTGLVGLRYRTQDLPLPTLRLLMAGSKDQKKYLAIASVLGIAECVFAGDAPSSQLTVVYPSVETPEAEALRRVGFVNQGSASLGPLGAEQSFGAYDCQRLAHYEMWRLLNAAHLTDGRLAFSALCGLYDVGLPFDHPQPVPAPA